MNHVYHFQVEYRTGYGGCIRHHPALCLTGDGHADFATNQAAVTCPTCKKVLELMKADKCQPTREMTFEIIIRYLNLAENQLTNQDPCAITEP